jgi:DNA-binding NarL/FixJ family response regulator
MIDRRYTWPFVAEGTNPTPHELAVFETVVDADTAKEAAHQLGLSDRTVKRITAQVRVRFGVVTNLQALREAMRRGLIH